jgi:fructokinase
VQHDPLHATGTVTVEPQPGATRYTFLPNSAWDFLEASPEWLSAMSAAKAVCFGTLAQRNPVSRDTIQKCLDAVCDQCLVVFDINLRPPFFDSATIVESLSAATIVKFNDEEAKTLQPLLGGPFGSEIEFAKWLVQAHGLEAVCITRGANGAVAVTLDEVVEVQGIPIAVMDTVGAGDAFTAGLIWSRLAGWPWEQTLGLANEAGALVASRPGAMPSLRNEFVALQSGK